MKPTATERSYSFEELRKILAVAVERERELQVIGDVAPADSYTRDEIFAMGDELGLEPQTLQTAMVALEHEHPPPSASEAQPRPPGRGHRAWIVGLLAAAGLAAAALGLWGGAGDQQASRDEAEWRVFVERTGPVSSPVGLVRAHLSKFITTFRTVTPNPDDTRRAMATTLSLVDGPARRAVFSDAIVNNPLERAATGSVAVSLTYVEPAAPGELRDWVLRWTEVITDLAGAEIGSTKWAARCRIRVRLAPAASEIESKANPLGLLIETFDWRPIE